MSSGNASKTPDWIRFRWARQIYDVVIGPVADDLQAYETTTILFSLDGVLRYLPMAALHDGGGFLVEKYRTVVLAEAGKYRLGDSPVPDWKVAALGTSQAFDGTAALPSVRVEMESIVRRDASDTDGVLPGVIYADSAFTREAMAKAIDLRLPVLHLASHFVLTPGTEGNSYLLLGDGSRHVPSGLPGGEHRFGGLDLLTLSACNTAVGAVGADGREVEGFGALAQNRGAKTVMATLWPVVDGSTAVFMREFYALRAPDGGPSNPRRMRSPKSRFSSSVRTPRSSRRWLRPERLFRRGTEGGRRSRKPRARTRSTGLRLS